MSFEQAVTQLEETNANLVQEVVRVRDAAMGLNKVFTTSAEGVAGVSDGDYFVVPGEGSYQKLFRRNGGDASLIAEYPSRQQLVDALAGVADAADRAEQAVTNGTSVVEDTLASSFDIHVPDPERRAVEAATGGQCTIERTPNGQSSYMFVLPKTTWDDLVPSGELGTGVHEAFIVDGVEKSELLVGMHMASEVGGELVSQPRRTAKSSISWDDSVSSAQAVNMQLMSNWEWSLLSFWCMANGFQPLGNTDYGASHSHPWERGVYDDNGAGDFSYTLTGSGPNAWCHNGSPNGIADLVGNKWEWQRGFKMVDGRIFIVPDNNPDLAESAWVDTGYDLPGDANPWSSLTQAGATQQVQRALIVPNGVADPDGKLYANLAGERVPYRGGHRSGGGNAGLGALHLRSSRTSSNGSLGLRLSRLV